MTLTNSTWICTFASLFKITSPNIGQLHDIHCHLKINQWLNEESKHRQAENVMQILPKDLKAEGTWKSRNIYRSYKRKAGCGFLSPPICTSLVNEFDKTDFPILTFISATEENMCPWHLPNSL